MESPKDVSQAASAPSREKHDEQVHTYAIFSVRFEPFKGGVETYTMDLARELVARGNEVFVITKRIDNSPEQEETESGIRVVRLPCVSLVNDRLPLSLRNKRHRELIRQLEAQGVDRVLVNNRFYPHSIDGLRFARTINAPAIVLDHGTDYLTMGNPAIDALIKGYEHCMTASTKRFNPTYAGISRQSAEWLRTFGIERAIVIPNAIDAEAFRLAASKRNYREELGVEANGALVAFVGRLTPEKGGKSLVRAARQFEGAPVEFALAGAGAMRGELEQMAGRNVHFLGLLDRSDLSALMRDADIFCLPSRSEGFCAALLEASVWATPSVITDVGVAGQVIPDPECGTIIADMTADSVAEGLAPMIGDAPRRREMGRRARTRVEGLFSWQAATEALDRAFSAAQGVRRT